MEVCTRASSETYALAERIAALVAPGDVIVLSGDLGAGKTVFAKGLARGLGVEEPVVSPTFTIVREYTGRVRVLHLDVYRLDHVQEMIDLGLDEQLAEDVVAIVEWGEAVGALLPSDRLEVRLDALPPEAADDDTRIVSLVPVGPTWLARADALAGLVAA